MPKEITYPCETGNASFNGEEAAVTVTINTTDNFSIEDVDELLNNQRLDFTLRMTPQGGEDPKQKKLLDDGHAHARAEIDVGGYSRAEAAVSFRVKIPKDRMNGFHSDDFGPGTGFLVVHGHSEIPEKVKVTSKPANGQQTFDSHEDVGPRPTNRPPADVTGPPEGASARNRSRAKKPVMTPGMEAAYKAGAEAALAYPDLAVKCPSKLPPDEARAWQEGYDKTKDA
jgi:hypothetical protein